MEQFDLTTLYAGKTGELLKRHLEFTISKYDKVSDIEEKDPIKLAVIVLARQDSIAMMKDILKLTEPIEKIEPLKDKTKQRYGLQD